MKKRPRFVPVCFTQQALNLTYGQWRARGGGVLGRIWRTRGVAHLEDAGSWDVTGMTMGEIFQRFPAKVHSVLLHCARTMDATGSEGLIQYTECRRKRSLPVQHDRRLAA